LARFRANIPGPVSLPINEPPTLCISPGYVSRPRRSSLTSYGFRLPVALTDMSSTAHQTTQLRRTKKWLLQPFCRQTDGAKVTDPSACRSALQLGRTCESRFSSIRSRHPHGQFIAAAQMCSSSPARYSVRLARRSGSSSTRAHR